MPKLIIDLTILKEYYGWILLGLVIIIFGIWLLYHKVIKPRKNQKRIVCQDIIQRTKDNSKEGIQISTDFEKFKPPENISNTLREWEAYLELKEKNLKLEWRDEEEKQKIDFAKSEKKKQELFEETQKVHDKFEFVRRLIK